MRAQGENGMRQSSSQALQEVRWTKMKNLPMNPEHDRQTTSILGREHVEEETILSDILILCARLELRVAERILRALRAVLTSIDDAASVEKRSLRSLPSKIAGRGSGEANTFQELMLVGGIVRYPCIWSSQGRR